MRRDTDHFAALVAVAIIAAASFVGSLLSISIAALFWGVFR